MTIARLRGPGRPGTCSMDRNTGSFRDDILQGMRTRARLYGLPTLRRYAANRDGEQCRARCGLVGVGLALPCVWTWARTDNGVVPVHTGEVGTGHKREQAMSDTPKLADECKKLLDNGFEIVLFRNELGSYTAFAVSAGEAGGLSEHVNDKCITDDFEPSQALYRLTEKMTTGRIA